MSRYKIVLFLSFLLSHGLYAKYLNFAEQMQIRQFKSIKTLMRHLIVHILAFLKVFWGLLNHFMEHIVKHYRRYQI